MLALTFSRNGKFTENISNEGEERASVESGLVFIPTTILFLLVLQFIFAGSWQTISNTQLDSYVTRIAMSGEGSQRSILNTGASISMPQEVFLRTGSQVKISEEQLPFGGQIVVGQAITKVPIISSFLGNLFRARSVSISVK